MMRELAHKEQGEHGHISVLLAETLEFLAPRPGGRYLDGTLGLGGHSEAILELAGQGAELLGLDRDAQALERARTRLARFGQAAHLVQAPYSSFEAEMENLGWDLLDGAVLDLGISSLQVDLAERGFSFMAEGPLDMRMDPGSGAAPASQIVNKASCERLKEIIRDLGEEPMAGRIARAIVEARQDKEIETTLELAAIVARAYPAKWRRTARNHPATRTFQALRMAVNSELEELEFFLSRITDRLRPGGRVVVISFHSLEDRLVKWAFRDDARKCRCPRTQPFCDCGGQPRLKLLTKKPLAPSEQEMAANPRSRSAKLRAAERVGEAGQ
ncbi:MAG: 16S rRNA (cytosine(1402)-N(4))-methyltransferase RsmH [Desulfocurvibacter africanus]